MIAFFEKSIEKIENEKSFQKQKGEKEPFGKRFFQNWTMNIWFSTNEKTIFFRQKQNYFFSLKTEFAVKQNFLEKQKKKERFSRNEKVFETQHFVLETRKTNKQKIVSKIEKGISRKWPFLLMMTGSGVAWRKRN